MAATDTALPRSTPSAIRESTLAEARRTMEICNACRYCEGYCAVFPAMERRRAFAAGDLAYLANLCHNCKGCWHACQYAPPHEFGLNLPATFAELRAETYAEHAWPAGAGRLFERNGFWVAMATALAIFAVMLGAIVFAGDALTGVHRGEGAFYAVIPHGVMVALGGVTFGFGVGASLMGAWRYWRASGGGPVSLGAIRAALADAATTRHLGGGGAGCNDIDERYGLGRRHLHMATMWGFIACFAATCAGTLMHYGFGWISPYPWYSAPVLLGSGGGIALMIGTAGLFWIKMRTDRGPEAVHRWGMDVGFLGLLFWTAATGMALLLFRHTSAMGGLLALHLGFVLALFAMLPYSKMVHGLYRLMALVRHHAERERTGR